MPDESLIERMAEAIAASWERNLRIPTPHDMARAAYEELPLGVEAFWDGQRFTTWFNPLTKTWEPFTEAMMADYARAGQRA